MGLPAGAGSFVVWQKANDVIKNRSIEITNTAPIPLLIPASSFHSLSRFALRSFVSTTDTTEPFNCQTKTSSNSNPSEALSPDSF
jgi:hypothetical protein